ncbi:ParB family chromosome partitioning protein [Catenuloplanes nepalensis]|uniref:ParB family chromosome partitioning protein n=1 Tax=Catenuloplanes nepalensis TaxID=587533 RepID=A0ABT9MMF9_9ACTN|nr:hypothetical protein [Catenuloplanes nepalensis]MDP9792600.1 ParB family chromosome partitioning protein [Catenuloplanes nepalensis]
MTTTVLPPNGTDPSYDDDLADSPPAQPGTDLEPAAPLGDVVTGDIVTGPLRLNLGDDADLPPIRAGRLDPHQLRDNPHNPRKDLGDLSDLTTSITAFGVLVPLVVIATPAGTTAAATLPPAAANEPPGTPISALTDEQIAALLEPGATHQPAAEEQFVIFMGHRRKHAAIAAGRPWVPCWIVPDESAARQIMGMLLENSHRDGLTPTEEADAYHQLTLEGWSAADIAAVRSVPTSTVHTALRARELPKAAQRALNAGTLTLDQAMALEEFKDAPRASERLLRELGDEWRFKQALASERDKRDYAAAKERAKATLVLDGVKATGKPAGFGYDSPAIAAGDLVDADGNPLDGEQVKTLPGFAAFVEKVGSQARTVVYCEDPAAYGYAKRPKPSRYGLSPEQAAAQAAKEQREAERREQLELDAGVRHDFLQATYGTAKAARKLWLEALRAAVTRRSLHRGDDLDELYKALGGSDAEALAIAGEDRLRRSLVARWVCQQEANLAYTTQTYQYNLDKEAAVSWYDRLTAEGYPLTDAELTVYQSLTKPDDEDDEDTDEQVEDEDDGDEDGAAGDHDLPIDSAAVSDAADEDPVDGADVGHTATAVDGTAPILAGQLDAEGVDDANHPVAAPVEARTTD